MIAEYVLALQCSIAFVIVTYKYLLKLGICQHKQCTMVVSWCLWINPYVWHELQMHLLQNIQTLLLLLIFINEVLNNQHKLKIRWLCIFILAVGYPVVAVSLLILWEQKKYIILLVFFIAAIHFCNLYSLLQPFCDICNLLSKHYKTCYFPSTSTPQLNLMWIFSAHMFTKYISFYQQFFILIATLSTYPLSQLPLSIFTKLLVIIFMHTYISYHCWTLQVLVFTLIYMSMLINFSNVALEKQFLFKVLCSIHSIASIIFVIICAVTVHIFSNSFLLNIGYVFLFLIILYIINVIYLTQIINLHSNNILAKKSSQKSKLNLVNDFIRLRLKNL